MREKKASELTSEDKHRLDQARKKYGGDRRFFMIRDSVYQQRPISVIIKKWIHHARFMRRSCWQRIRSGQTPAWLRPCSEVLMLKYWDPEQRKYV